MKEIKSGDTIIRVRGSNLALLYFHQEFKDDIVKATSRLYASFQSIAKSFLKGKTMAEIENLTVDSINLDEIDISAMMPNAIEVLKITWAMNKAQNAAESIQTPCFEQWLEKYPDLSALEIMKDVLEEAKLGFFRTSQSK
jgi:hypothetical protein